MIENIYKKKIKTMEITQQSKIERFAYTTTIDDTVATCNIVLREGIKRQASAEMGSIVVRKPEDVATVEFSCATSELPSDVNSIISTLEAFIDECVSKHTIIEGSTEIVE